MKYSKEEVIKQGMSKDKKYIVLGEDGKRYFLRVVEKKNFYKSPIGYYREANIDIGGDRVVRICDCVENDDYYECYFEYVEGVSLERYIDGVNKKEIIELATRSARLLRNIQNIHTIGLANTYDEKYILSELQRCKDYLGTNKILDFIYENIKYLFDANNNTFLHSDYHLGNLILTDKNELVVVDIEKYEYGSFYRDLLINETYNRMVSDDYARALLYEYSLKSDFDWMTYNVHMSFYYVRFILWSKRKKGITIDEKSINNFYLEHCIEPDKMPCWVRFN